jgi:hypothetical protein
MFATSAAENVVNDYVLAISTVVIQASISAGIKSPSLSASQVT